MAEKARDDERMRLETFLEWDDGTDTRYELVDGQVVAMNPPAPAHAALLINLGAALRSRMPRGCRAYGVGGVVSAEDDWTYRVPDVVVSCTQSHGKWLEAPRLICEILSPSTAKYDVTGKLDLYRAIPSVDEILVLRAEARQATLWRRSGDHWIVEDYIGSAILPIATTTSSLPLDEIYDHLEDADTPPDPA